MSVWLKWDYGTAGCYGEIELRCYKYYNNISIIYLAQQFCAFFRIQIWILEIKFVFKKYIFFQYLQEAIFTKEWICVGRKDQVDEPGKYFSGCVTQNPFIVVNDDSQIKAFFNVCRHHAAQIVENDSEGCAQRYSTCSVISQRARNFEKVQAKILVKSNKSKKFSHEITFLAISKMAKNQFFTEKKFTKMEFHEKNFLIYLILRVFWPGLF